MKPSMCLTTNKGKSELDIRSMQMFTMGLQVNLKKSKIQPGETNNVKGEKIKGVKTIVEEVR